MRIAQPVAAPSNEALIARLEPGTRADDSVDTDKEVVQVDPCAHLTHTLTMGLEYVGHEYPITRWVQASNIVAKGVITAMEAPIFNTTDGLPPANETPTPYPATPSDPEEKAPDIGNDQIFSLVVIDATEIYSGSQFTGYVVLRWGGTSAQCPDYTFEVEPDILSGSVADQGMFFITEFHPDTLQRTPPPAWMVHATTYRDQLNSDRQDNYLLAHVINWYRYDPPDAWSEMTIPRTIATLEADVIAATQ